MLGVHAAELYATKESPLRFSACCFNIQKGLPHLHALPAPQSCGRYGGGFSIHPALTAVTTQRDYSSSLR